MMEDIKGVQHLKKKRTLKTNKNSLFELLLQPLDRLLAGVQLTFQVTHLDLGHSFYTYSILLHQSSLLNVESVHLCL